MSLINGQIQTLQGAGIVCSVAAIVGGGIKWGSITIPKILSRRRQLLLGGFGVLLLFAGLGPSTPLLRAFWAFSVAIAPFALFIGFFVTVGIIANKREQNFRRAMQEHMGSPKDLVEDAQKAFWQKQYAWTLKYCTQALVTAREDTWECGSAFLLGAQVSLGKKKAAKQTQGRLIDAIRAAARNQNNQVECQQSLDRIAVHLTSIKMEVGRRSLFSSRTEIDLVLETINDERRTKSTDEPGTIGAGPIANDKARDGAT